MTFPFLSRTPVVAVLRLQGVIAAGGRGMDDQSMGPVIERAFRRRRLAAVALQINSPGGSPVQSSLIAARIRRLAEEKGVPVIAFVEDVAASGGYWIAAAADEIVVDPASIVGSIGVISAGFGFPGLLERVGVERRVHTAGRAKSQLDPFRPEAAEDVARLQGLLDQLHQVFIGHVQARRGARLKGGDELYSGEVWIGAAAVDKGLADDVGHLVPVLKARFGKDVRLIRHGARRSLLSRLGMGLGTAAMAAVEERVAWARWGL